MTDLRQAAQQALHALVLCRDWVGAYDECSQAVKALEAALAAPQPKPVAYYDSQRQKIIWARRTRYSEPLVTDLPILPLYLHPLQRQPLTDEELKKIWYDVRNIMGWYSFQEIARAIEKAHGIGGDK